MAGSKSPSPARTSATAAERQRGKRRAAATEAITKAVGPAPTLRSKRAGRAAQRREAIVVAALDEFIARGFAAARLEDVAKRAGVAKGTIYLHFGDKEALFIELIRTALVPLISRLAAQPSPGVSVRATMEALARSFAEEVLVSRRGEIIRLVIAEGTRFPDIADFYYREVVSRGLAGIRALLELGAARGEIRQASLTQFPQLVIGPALIAVVWQALFARHTTLDAVGMLRVHLDLIFGEGSKP